MKKRIMTVLVASAVAIGAAVAVAPTIFAADKSADARPFSLPSERIEARLAYEKTALKITSAQQKQWDAYADGLRKEAADMDKVVKEYRDAMKQARDKGDKDAMPKDKLTSAERLQKQKDFLDAAEKNLDSKIALYKVLTPEQQQVADEVLGGGFGGFGGGPGHGGMRGGGCEHGGEHGGHGDGPRDWKNAPPPPPGNE